MIVKSYQEMTFNLYTFLIHSVYIVDKHALALCRRVEQTRYVGNDENSEYTNTRK